MPGRDNLGEWGQGQECLAQGGVGGEAPTLAPGVEDETCPLVDPPEEVTRASLREVSSPSGVEEVNGPAARA